MTPELPVALTTIKPTGAQQPQRRLYFTLIKEPLSPIGVRVRKQRIFCNNLSLTAFEKED